MLDIFTKGSGRVCLATKDIYSKRSILKGALQPFISLLLCFGGRGKVKMLHSVEAVSLALPLSGIMLYNGLYINELLSRVLEYKMRPSELFFDYSRCTQSPAGATGTPEPALRHFKPALFRHLGYGVNFAHRAGSGEPIDDTMAYCYHEEKGFVTSVVIDNKALTGRRLKALNAREFPDADTLHATKRFTRMALKPRLGGKPLKSGKLLQQSIPKRTMKTHYE